MHLKPEVLVLGSPLHMHADSRHPSVPVHLEPRAERLLPLFAEISVFFVSALLGDA